MNIIEDIKKIVKDNSYLDFDESTETPLTFSFSTRENGDVGEEVASQIDINNAFKAKKAILEKYPNIKVKVDTVDEWTILDVDLKEPAPPHVRYTFYRYYNGSFFDLNTPMTGTPFNDINLLIKKVKKRLPKLKLTKDKLITQLDEIVTDKENFVGYKYGILFLTKDKPYIEDNCSYCIKKEVEIIK